MKPTLVDLSTHETYTITGQDLCIKIKEKENYLSHRIAVLSTQLVHAPNLPAVLEIGLGFDLDIDQDTVTLGLCARELFRAIRLRRRLLQLHSLLTKDNQHVYTLSRKQLVDCELQL